MDISRFQGLDVVLVCGLPGSGKSTFAAQSFTGTGHRRVNRKEIRRFIYSMTRFGEPWSESYYEEHDESLVKNVEHRIIEHLLRIGERVLIDNTCVTIASRAAYLQMAHQAKKRIGVIFLNRPALTCLQQNRMREDPVPESVISNLYASIELPTTDEGFREALILT